MFVLLQILRSISFNNNNNNNIYLSPTDYYNCFEYDMNITRRKEQYRFCLKSSICPFIGL